VSPASTIVELCDEAGALLEPLWLARAEAVHRQLRVNLGADYPAILRRVLAGGGRMCVAASGEVVTGVAVYRIQENTHDGLHLYVDDLVTDEAGRSRGVGKALLDHLERRARAAGCAALKLDSGTQRQRAHRFYFREGMAVVSFHFVKSLDRG
jgi:GNAT superfamily N-acetyltransferase